jgi:hypothetical protein
MALFEVFMVYGEDRDNPGAQHKFVVADDAKQAELKSGLLADPEWDFDYVTMFSRPIPPTLWFTQSRFTPGTQ